MNRRGFIQSILAAAAAPYVSTAAGVLMPVRTVHSLVYSLPVWGLQVEREWLNDDLWTMSGFFRTADGFERSSIMVRGKDGKQPMIAMRATGEMFSPSGDEVICRSVNQVPMPFPDRPAVISGTRDGYVALSDHGVTLRGAGFSVAFTEAS